MVFPYHFFPFYLWLSLKLNLFFQFLLHARIILFSLSLSHFSYFLFCCSSLVVDCTVEWPTQITQNWISYMRSTKIKVSNLCLHFPFDASSFILEKVCCKTIYLDDLPKHHFPHWELHSYLHVFGHVEAFHSSIFLINLQIWDGYFVAYLEHVDFHKKVIAIKKAVVFVNSMEHISVNFIFILVQALKYWHFHAINLVRRNQEAMMRFMSLPALALNQNFPYLAR